MHQVGSPCLQPLPWRAGRDPQAENEFFYRVVDASITFERDVDGAPAVLVLHQNGRDMRCERVRD